MPHAKPRPRRLYDYELWCYDPSPRNLLTRLNIYAHTLREAKAEATAELGVTGLRLHSWGKVIARP